MKQKLNSCQGDISKSHDPACCCVLLDNLSWFVNELYSFTMWSLMRLPITLIYFLLLQQIQSNFVVVIHPGSRSLRIGRATDTLPVTIPHVMARRHKQGGQPRYEDAWLLREGLNVSLSRSNGLILQDNLNSYLQKITHHLQCVHNLRHRLTTGHFAPDLHSLPFLSIRSQKVKSRGRMGSKWSTRLFGPRRCRMECGGLLCLLSRCVVSSIATNLFLSNALL